MNRSQTRIRLIVSFLAVAICDCPMAPHANAQDANSAHQFVESLYKLYANNASGGVPSSGPHARLYYHSSLLALMRADEKAAGPGYVGAIDADPVCGCQDWDGIWNLKIDIQMQDVSHATARVSFALNAPGSAIKDHQRRILFTLVAENGAWRIWNIRDESGRQPFDIREALRDDIRTAKASHSRPKH
jgi:hypothetical protein